jgi:gamma-tubulin complex component 2
MAIPCGMQGDFLVHFMDTARDELAKRPSAMSMEKLQSLLELALRTSVAASDPYHEDLTCNIERSNLLTQLQNISQNGAGPAHYNSQRTDSTDASSLQGMASGSITGLETFTLDYKVRWPLSLVISRKALTKYQLIFRHLFHCKHVERQLCATWQLHQVHFCVISIFCSFTTL